MPGAALILAAAAMLAAPAPASGHEAEVGHAVFDLCPRVLDGSLAVDDPTALRGIGFEATAPRQTPSGPIPRATRGSGPETIVLSGRKKEDGGTCSVWFGGADNEALFKALRKRARKSGFAGTGKPLQLGDGTDIYSFRASARRSLIFIAGAAGDGIGPYPTTTAVMMDTKGE
ncbi:MAG TPA: hypothetical protein VFQ67_05700 [Allosphingosinicella sp.]|jgi:hypothetical protein|nr:hypothetical protein [Allosphingosinicella sp.]